MYIDSHSHTKHFSSDASMSISEVFNACSNKNVSKLVITEHYDYDYPHPEEPQMYCDLDAYLSEFLKWKETFNTYPTKLLFGIEFGYQPHLIDYYEKLAKDYPFDSIILSNHLYNGIDIYFSKECYNERKESRVSNYMASLIEMADKCDCYDIIGHYDYINRYSPNKDEDVLYSDCPKMFDTLFEILISKEKSLEINTASIEKRIRNNANNIMPDSEIIKRYIEMGGKLITLGSDAHKAEAIAQNFSATIEYLKSLDVKELCYFENRKVKLYSI